MNLKSLVADYLRKSADDLDNDMCSLTDEEVKTLATQLLHIELNKSEAADLLNISTRTFDRKIKNGEIPKGQHIRGSKELVWYEDEIVNNIKNDEL